MRATSSYLNGHRRGSVLLIVLITLVFATSALLLFIERAGTDLLVDIREADAARLRQEAYSALETTLAVLEDFRIVNDGLHGPAEGWGDPLSFAGYEPTDGRTVEVKLEDESAKLPLPKVKAEQLVDLFKYWKVPQTDAERMADSLLVWIKKGHTATAMGAPSEQDYENAPLAFNPPGRSLRSFAELASIEGLRQAFFDPDTGAPNELYQRFTDTFSIYDYDSANLNGNNLDPLLAQQKIDEQQQRHVADYLLGKGSYQTQGPGFFKNARSVAAVAGGQLEKLGYGYKVSALKITVLVRQQQSSFQLTAVVAPEGGAKVVGASAPAADSTSGDGETKTPSPPSYSDKPATQGVDLKYPFTFLEIRENDSAAPSPVSPDSPTE